MLNKIIAWFLENKLVSILIFIALIVWGIAVSPFNWDTGFIPKDSVPVDAIPDIGENQQIVFTKWPGRSPQDIEDQISYPLTTYLLGIPGVKTIRSSSIFGFSSIYIIFDDDVEFYWSRSRILEKLSSIPSNLLPDGVSPTLGPDATALGQVYWYTLEGRDEEGRPTGGWDLHELRTIQDFYVKYGLNATEGVSEVASVGGFVKEYQVDVDPNALLAYNISLEKVINAVKNSNADVGAKTIEINKAEYLVRGLGYVENVSDIEKAVVDVQDNTPIRIKDIAVVHLGPAPRRGILDKGGAEVVGGVVVARYGSNPLKVINNLKERIAEIAPGLPKKVLPDGRTSQLTIVPFYDRSELIHETVGTLETALSHEILISIIVVLILVLNLRASLIISGLLPVGVLMTFIAMRYSGVDANIVALSGIAIAIGVMVDVGIVFVENIVRHLEMPKNRELKGKQLGTVIYDATVEVAPAVTTALATTIVSFIPVFAMEAAEGKLFRPLAFTKTFALLGAFILGLVILPTLAQLIFGLRTDKKRVKRFWSSLLIAGGFVTALYFKTWIPLALCVIGINGLLEKKWTGRYKSFPKAINLILTIGIAAFYLSKEWLPLGPATGLIVNYLFVLITIGVILALLFLIVKFYVPILRWCLANKGKFMLIPLFTIMLGVLAWIGFDSTFGIAAKLSKKAGWNLRETGLWKSASATFPGLGSEFMPALDEGSFLLMPTTMPHSGVEYNREILGKLDMLVSAIPEVELAVGKLGRVESALDPAPVSMFENTITYKPEYMLDTEGHRMRFKVDDQNRFITVEGDSLSNAKAIEKEISKADLIVDADGEYYRNWRPEINSPDDIWAEIVKQTRLPGVTSAPKLQPIETRLVMLQTGMRAPMGIKVFGPDLETIESFGKQLEPILKSVPSVNAGAVFADRIVGKPYLELDIDRDAIARYGLTIADVQRVIETAIGGKTQSVSVEGRERFPIRVRYPRELRDDPEALRKIMVATPTESQIPLGQLVDIKYARGPQAIKSENTFLTGYVLFDKVEGQAETDVVNDAKAAIQDRIDSGDLIVPAGLSYTFSGNYENQIRANKRLAIVIPISLLIIFLLLYFQFKTVIASSIHFSGVFVALAGGFIMLWLYSKGWFMDFSIAGTDMRDLFQIHTINLSVAVWVGFIALFGIATDDGVIMGTYIHQVFEQRKPGTITEVREAVVEAGQKRVRPAMMTAAVAIIALLPILTSTGKGSDIMIPMAIPTFGGMAIQTMTMFVVPILQAYWRETVIKRQNKLKV